MTKFPIILNFIGSNYQFLAQVLCELNEILAVYDTDKAQGHSINTWTRRGGALLG